MYPVHTKHPRVGTAWKLAGRSDNGIEYQQLTEARFLAAFCCAVYGQRDPELVCATAAQWLYEYFGYRQAHFSFAGPEVESFSYQPGAQTIVRQVSSTTPPSALGTRTFSVAGSDPDAGVDITVHFPAGLGQLRILEAKQGKPGACEDFLQNIAECLGSALEKSLEHKRLQELSLRDSLTGLLNRRAFEELLEMEEERREAPPQSLVMIDIDNFKSINDRYGHPAGDQVIVEVAGVIKDALRGADLATRYGGEEFAVLLPGTSATDALAAAERIRSRVLSRGFQFSRRKVHVTASLGVATRYAKKDCSLRELLTLADEALYQAKRSGKNMTIIHPACLSMETPDAVAP
jgi:two-component system, cell cycle response regulator